MVQLSIFQGIRTNGQSPCFFQIGGLPNCLRYGAPLARFQCAGAPLLTLAMRRKIRLFAPKSWRESLLSELCISVLFVLCFAKNMYQVFCELIWTHNSSWREKKWKPHLAVAFTKMEKGGQNSLKYRSNMDKSYRYPLLSELWCFIHGCLCDWRKSHYLFNKRSICELMILYLLQVGFG